MPICYMLAVRIITSNGSAAEIKVLLTVPGSQPLTERDIHIMSKNMGRVSDYDHI